MLNVRKMAAACNYDLRKMIINPKLYAILLLIVMFASDRLGNLSSFLTQFNVKISAFGLAGYLLSDVQMTLLMVVGGMILFSNAPFIDDGQLLLVIRTRKKEWVAGQQMYIHLFSFLLVLTMSLAPLLLFAGQLDFTNTWDKAISTLTQTNMGSSYQVKIQFLHALQLKFTPYNLYWIGLLFKWILIDILAQVMFSVNVIQRKRYGIIVVLAYSLLDISIEQMLSTELYKYSLVSLSRLSTLGTGYLYVLPTFEYRSFVFSVAVVLMSGLSYILAIRSDILESF